ncbi:MAG: hypothetical protein QF822_03145 [Candidatus Poseidoniia archaeon]|nr:hypothetical protein [Euryarchaeota archaeon]MDP6489513.1 hypothetical protein [Candidatus Poseidoniia archaeon]MDP6534203.1 hypothetical protein [Candidatus Poseidoniia archaeon]MDP6835413.1 hypothetical protein [Candidatus Poseidoniia archaeon]HIH79241.1 MoaD/ThiS family protein [Candidatus Poseidoniia archaeon]
MKRRVTVGGEERDVKLAAGATASDLIDVLELHPDGVLVLAEGEPLQPVALTSTLPDGGIRVVLVASGG